MINSLQSLRGIFAIFIFLHHIKYNGENVFLDGGPCGVSFFFILSGFVMSAGWQKKIDKRKITKTQLFIRRIIRVYPLHLLCLFVTILLSIGHLSINYFLKLIPNLLLLQSWFPIQSVYFSGNALSWCLCNMMFFYMTFPFIMIIIEKHIKVFNLSLIFLILSYLYGINFIPESYRHALIYINPIFRLLDFLIGIVLWQFWLKLKKNNIRIPDSSTMRIGLVNLLEIGSVITLVLTLIFSKYISEAYYYDAYWWGPICLLIIVFTFFNKSGGYWICY